MQLILTLIENPYAYPHPILEGDTRSWQTLLTLYLSKPKDLWCCWIPAKPYSIQLQYLHSKYTPKSCICCDIELLNE